MWINKHNVWGCLVSLVEYIYCDNLKLREWKSSNKFKLCFLWQTYSIENNADLNDLPMENANNYTCDLSIRMTMISYIFMFLEFMRIEFSKLFGFLPPLQWLLVLSTSNQDTSKKELLVFILLFRSHLDKLAIYSLYHPHAFVASRISIKHWSWG